MTGPIVHIGVDVSKNSLDLTPFDRGGRQIPNTDAGIRRLIKRIERFGAEVRVCCEATGGYEARLCDALVKAGIPVARINPHRSKHYASSKGQFAKTDSIDARLLGEFSAVHMPRLLRPEEPWRRDLKALCIRRQTLIKMALQEESRLEPPPSGVVAKGIRSHIRLLKGRTNKIEQQLRDMRKKIPGIKTLCTRLELLQGIGAITSINLVALVPELGQLTAKQAAKLAGLAPFNDDSGVRTGTRRIQAGRSRVRASLYMGALSAIQHNPVLSVLYKRLLDAGKPPKVAITAVMRRMMIAANRLIADPEFVPVGSPKMTKESGLSTDRFDVDNGTNVDHRSPVGNAHPAGAKPPD